MSEDVLFMFTKEDTVPMFVVIGVRPKVAFFGAERDFVLGFLFFRWDQILSLGLDGKESDNYEMFDFGVT